MRRWRGTRHPGMSALLPYTRQILALALIGLYLVDSVHWLSLGEAVVITRRGALRRISCGAAFELGGRRPWLPNPFTPFWPELRVLWLTRPASATDPAESAQHMRTRAASLALTGIFCAVCAAAIVLGAPLALLAGREDVFLILAALALVSALTASGFLYVRREVLGLTRTQWLSLSFTAIACLPLSANLARAVARSSRWTLSAHDLAALELTDSDAQQTRALLLPVMRAAQRYLPEDSAVAAALAEQLRQLEESA